jgi:chaperonin GroES
MNYDNLNSGTSESPESADTSQINQLLESKNIAEKLKENKLTEISEQVLQGFKKDLESRTHWIDSVDTWIELAMQVSKEKSFPWPGASNVKYPLISTAAMQFAARAYPTLVPSDGQVVKGTVIGKDQDGEKEERASRIGMYMSYQVMKQMDNWEEDMDKLLIMLPIVGTVFKKTFYDKASDKIKSYVVSPKNLVVNYWARSLDDAERVSEIIEMPKRILIEMQKAKAFRDVALDDPSAEDIINKPIEGHYYSSDDAIPYTLVEQHTFLDLDDDGYTEPYIVTFDSKTGEILRIQARFRKENVKTDDQGKLISIKPTQYYTKFSFVPNSDGSFYDIGFGNLLGPINESVNTLINQLVDSGTLNNLQSGFIGKGLKIRMGDSSFSPGEWKQTQSTSDDLKKQILPLPTKEPSEVLFKLMTAMISAGKELASVAEIFTGKMPGQNTPATTTMASVEQGMKVFTAVYKRIYRSLTKEFKLIFELNKIYLDPNQYSNVVDSIIGPNDFDTENYDVCPAADPDAASTQEKTQKAMALLQLLPIGILDPIEVVTRVLKAQEQPNPEKLFNQQVQQTGQMPQQPDPKAQEIQMKGQFEQQKIQLQAQSQQHKMELESRSQEQQLSMKAQEHALELQAMQAKSEAAIAAEQHKTQSYMYAQQQQHTQKLQQQQEAHAANLQQVKEQQKLSQSKTSTTGKQIQSQKPTSKK